MLRLLFVIFSWIGQGIIFQDQLKIAIYDDYPIN